MQNAITGAFLTLYFLHVLTFASLPAIAGVTGSVGVPDVASVPALAGLPVVAAVVAVAGVNAVVSIPADPDVPILTTEVSLHIVLNSETYY
jgi:hypothetical protein